MNSNNTQIMKKVGLKRNIIDKYYTSNKTVIKCMSFINEYINILKDDIIIEPSAGNGSFIEEIKSKKCNYKFYDLEPEHKEIIKQDYLTLNIEIYNNTNYNKIHIIGNPPFGRQSSLVIKFIKKSCLYCDTFSFILPKSFKKDSLKKHIPLNFHLIYEYDLPNDSFLVDNKEYNVPCVFQIWIKKNILRLKPEKLLPKNYKFVKKNEIPDISFRRVGINAGNISTEIENKSEQSHYFIKFDNLTNELFEKLKNINYTSKDNTVGPKSISKQELIKEFNIVI